MLDTGMVRGKNTKGRKSLSEIQWNDKKTVFNETHKISIHAGKWQLSVSCITL